ncbi:unnamed protein product [Ascophyllum nodosum]
MWVPRSPERRWCIAVVFAVVFLCASEARGRRTAQVDRCTPRVDFQRRLVAQLRGGADGFVGKQVEDPFLGGRPLGDRLSPPLASRLAPSFPEALPAGPVHPSSRKVPVLRLSSSGSAVETTLSRQQLAAELNCPLRDLRVADPTFPAQFPSVLARCSAIIFSVKDVKAVIRSNELLLFPTTQEVLSVVTAIQEKVQGGADWTGIGSVSFEQTALECCLKYVCKGLLESVRDVEPRLRTVLDSFETEKNSLIKSLQRLLPLKNELDELQETLGKVRKCMNEVLVNDEDMALMYLTDREHDGGKEWDPRHHQEVEIMFENYLLQVELLASDVRDFQNEVRNTEEIVEIELDVLRNNILRFELLLSVSGLTVALGALVTGVFGMNLISGWEMNPHAFWRLTGGIYGFIVLCIAATVAWCRRMSLLQEP